MHNPDSSGRAVLIDLDGTLIDTAPDIVATANRMLDELDVAPLMFSTVRSFIGNGVPNLVRRALEARGVLDIVDEQYAQQLFYRHYQDTNGRFSSVYPGVRKGVARLKEAGYRLGCVTNKPFPFAEQLLRSMAMDGDFDTLVGGGSVPQMKPSPVPLLHACRLLQVKPKNAVMVGDSVVDIVAARAAGMPVCIVSYGYSTPVERQPPACDALVDSFEELPDLLPGLTMYLHEQ